MVIVPIIILYATSVALEKARSYKNFHVIEKITLSLKGSKVFLRIKFKTFLDCLTAEQLEKVSRAFFQYMVTAFIHWLLWKIFNFSIAFSLEKLGFFNYMGNKFVKLFSLFDIDIQIFCSIFAQEMESILASRAIRNPLTRQQWEDFFLSTLTEYEEGIEIFRSLVIEIIMDSIGAQPIEIMKMVKQLDNSGEFILLPRQNTEVIDFMRSIEKSTILWSFSRYYQGYDFTKLMRDLKSYYSGYLPYQCSMRKRYLEFLKESLIIVVITTSKK